MRITVVGTGYVGLSLAALLSIKNKVIALDINKKRIDMINEKISPIADKKIEEIFKNQKNNKIIATFNKEKAYRNCDVAIICTPTDYDPITNKFDTSSIIKVVKDILNFNKKTIILIKSTIPIGFTEILKKNFLTVKLFFHQSF